MNQLVSEQHTGLIKFNGGSTFGHLPLFGVQKKCVNTILVLWCVGQVLRVPKGALIHYRRGATARS